MIYSTQKNKQNSQEQPIKTALISVSDKTNLVEFAQFLQNQSIKILSTGGSAEMMIKNGISVIQVSDFTAFPEIMGGRVKTLQPKIHGGILARRDQDQAIMKQLDIETIDLVVVNLYPFTQTISDPNCPIEKAIENIDIGGPAMIRSAAKNFKWVSILINPQDYFNFIDNYQSGKLDENYRFHLAQKAFDHTASYDRKIADYLDTKIKPEKQSLFTDKITIELNKKLDLRYGENAHQKAALYHFKTENTGLAQIEKLQGKELSYNNFVDTDAAYSCIQEFSTEKKACVIVKHANPCGVALAKNLQLAYQKAYSCDQVSAFGGIIAFNSQVDHLLAKTIIQNQFVEVIIAPQFSSKSLKIFAQKPNIRLLKNPLENYCDQKMIKHINGALLLQDKDNLAINSKNFKVVSKKKPTTKQINDLLFAFKVVKHIKSNAIVYAKNEQTLAIGSGQMSRIYASKIAQIKAKDGAIDLVGSVLASDAFFPFKDSIQMATEAGVSAIIQPGGSIKDSEVIAEANKQKIAMVFSGSRHFWH